MKKVGIITFHFVNNFGGVLQAYALQRFLREQCGADSVMINYRNPFIVLCDVIRLFPVTGNPREAVVGITTFRKRLSRYARVKRWCSDRMVLSRKYYTYSALRKNPPGCTHYIAGGDQIWNAQITFGFDRAYYLGFAEKDSVKMSYAASFGEDRLTAFQQKRIKRYFPQFRSVSVRERLSGVQCEKAAGCSVTRLIDPVFLLNVDDWSRVYKVDRSEKDYILIYMMQFDERIYKVAEYLKKKTGKRVIEISRYGYKRQGVDKLYIDIDPSEFVGFFKGADYVCTNSYHGIIFSLIFEKELYLVKCKRFRERMNNIIELFNIQDPEKSPVLHAAYDKAYARGVIMKEREAALKYLKENIPDSYD